jgi:NAD(P)H-quinone oxidoreductase subunit 5
MTYPQPFAATVAALLAVLGPLLLLAVGLVPTRTANRLAQGFSRGVAALALGVCGMMVTVGIALLISPQPAGRSLGSNGFSVDLYLDALSLVMLLLVSFLAAVVTRYSCNYLAGDPQQGRFSKWLSVTIGSVLLLILSGNLLLFTLAWVATSMSLHRLLTFYVDRPAAILAARKKFLISRLGDACLVGALAFTWQCFGTWNFAEMFAQVDALRASGGTHAECLGWTSVLLVAGALLKSAQFPFHSWLPDTMETPTPVSALMHAGIINAGGFLIVRLSPLVASSPAALNALALVGAFTALFASVVMLTQTSVKRSLAYSTIAQMGFMMLQCGLGAFALAVLHIVAHSLYKAHAFLSSGSIVSISRSAWMPSERPAAHPVILAGTLGTAVALTWIVGSLFGVSLESGPGVLLLGSVFMMGLAYLLWNLWASSHRAALLGWGLAMSSAAAVSYFALHAAFEKLLAPALPHYAPQRSPLEYGVMALVVLLFLAVLVFQSQLPSWSATRLGRALYVHASQGFYLGTFANRVTRTLSGKVTA